MPGEAAPAVERGPAFGRKVMLFLAVFGPGLITANVDNDAGGITTYSLAGANYGYDLLWSLIPITVALVVVQEMSARMGVVTGKGLADLIRENFGVRITFWISLALIVANLANTIAEFSGVAASLQIMEPWRRAGRSSTSWTCRRSERLSCTSLRSPTACRRAIMSRARWTCAGVWRTLATILPPIWCTTLPSASSESTSGRQERRRARTGPVWTYHISSGSLIWS